jgi:DNA-binding NarL/FixJ family response regulator
MKVLVWGFKMNEIIKILLVDDEATVRAGLRMRMELEPDLAITGEAGNGLEALQLVQDIQPDVVVMDVEMPKMDGITAAIELQRRASPPSVVMSSIHDDARTRSQAKAAGAVAFVGKQEGVDRLIDTIRQMARFE